LRKSYAFEGGLGASLQTLHYGPAYGPCLGLRPQTSVTLPLRHQQLLDRSRTPVSDKMEKPSRPVLTLKCSDNDQGLPETE